MKWKKSNEKVNNFLNLKDEILNRKFIQINAKNMITEYCALNNNFVDKIYCHCSLKTKTTLNVTTCKTVLIGSHVKDFHITY